LEGQNYKQNRKTEKFYKSQSFADVLNYFKYIHQEIIRQVIFLYFKLWSENQLFFWKNEKP